MEKKQIEEMIDLAIRQMDYSYVPYSHFHVGAALLAKNGTYYTGCNIENAAYTPTNCAERTAFFKAVSEGVRDFQAICIVGGKDGVPTEYAAPCGVCRQVMIDLAIRQLDYSYVPYSHFHVGAALLAKNGTYYTGCNIENAAYTPTNCAERTAFFKAVSEGVREFQAICIVGGKDGVLTEYAAPCGVCRQVMMEFCDPETFQIILAVSKDKYDIFALKELLPLGFGPANLA